MTQPERLDQSLRAWLDAEAQASSSHYLEETLALLERTPQRRWRAALTHALPAVRRPVVPRGVVALAMLAVLIAALAAAAVIIGSRPRLPAPFGPAANGLIAYDDGIDAYIAQADGSGAVQIPGGKRYNFNPTFSPDGTLVAFWSNDTGSGGSLFVAPADGRTPARLMGTGTVLQGPVHVPPAWAPDSASIAYPGWAPDGRVGIYVADVTSGVSRFLEGSTEAAGFPAWSPDGRTIAYRSFDGRSTLLTITEAIGGNPEELVGVAGDVDAFTQIGWSPDGSALVYHRPHEEHGAQTVIAVYHLDEGEHVVSSGERPATAPTWSTDGQQIAYVEDILDVAGAIRARELLIASVDGEAHRPLGAVADCVAFWSPDSKYLISYAQGCFNDRLVIVPVQGGAVQTIRLSGNIAGAPSWQRIAAP
jgi:Tol biopolymer transport system component